MYCCLQILVVSLELEQLVWVTTGRAYQKTWWFLLNHSFLSGWHLGRLCRGRFRSLGANLRRHSSAWHWCLQRPHGPAFWLWAEHNGTSAAQLWFWNQGHSSRQDRERIKEAPIRCLTVITKTVVEETEISPPAVRQTSDTQLQNEWSKPGA